ncbi:MAG: hypothetical protein DMG58_32150 [Acidobacteria bacterium]|nr:MAG: hypothetical protein DMG58_32150 [Acidobacteriota bacterium]
MSKYVVTGGAGFIGSALVRGLLRDGASKVVVIDNLLTKSASRSRSIALTSVTTPPSPRSCAAPT